MSYTPDQRFMPSAVLLGTLAAALIAPAALAEGGWYAGAGTTPGSLSLSTPFDVERRDHVLNARDFTPDPGKRLFGGYRLDRTWAMEAGYLDLGDGVALDRNYAAPTADPASARGYTLTGTGTLPLNQGLSLYGKVGVFQWNADTRGPLSGDRQGFDFTYGAGGQYGLGENLSLTAEWEHFLIDRQDIDLFSAGLRYQFQ
jgi:OOP family OmpA-OmpF porin